MSNKCEYDMCNKGITHILEVIFAFIIILHHVSVSQLSQLYYKNELNLFSEVGVYCIGFFLFTYGYSIMKRFMNTGFISFFKTRILPIIVTFFFCNYAYMLITQLMGQRYDTVKLISAFFGIQLLNDQMWFAVVLIILYVLFWLVFKHVKNRKAAMALYLMLILIIMMGSMFQGHIPRQQIVTNWFYGEWWYNTMPCFFLGMLYATSAEAVNKIIDKLWWAIVPVFAAVMVICYRYTHIRLYYGGYWTDTAFDVHLKDKLLTLGCQLPSVVAFLVVMVVLIRKININIKGLGIIRAFTLELILINNIFIYVCIHIDNHLSIASFLVLEIGFTYISAFILNLCRNMVLGTGLHDIFKTSDN